MTEIDRLFTLAREGDVESFEKWMGSVELPIRLSLRRFARAVDVESVVQETLLRMWVLARESTRTLEGDNASLKFALGMARNMARSEARRSGREILLPPEEMPENEVAPAPPSDSGLRQAILDCMEKLAKKPLLALRFRLEQGGVWSDSEIAARLRMTTNTFLQNITRAKRHMANCLERRGVRLGEIVT